MTASDQQLWLHYQLILCVHICTIVVCGVCIVKCCTTQTYYSACACVCVHEWVDVFVGMDVV